MWKEVSKAEYENGIVGWDLVNGGHMFGGGEFKEYGHRDGHGLWRWQINANGVESWMKFNFSR